MIPFSLIYVVVIYSLQKGVALMFEMRIKE